MTTVLGWDSETCNGYVVLLRHSGGAFVETPETFALLDFLFDEGLKADYNVFWNVRFDFGAIIKGWVVHAAPELKQNHLAAIRLRKRVALFDAERALGGKLTAEQTRERRDALRSLDGLESVEHFDLGKYRVLYIPKKGFRLTRSRRQRGKNSVTFFDAMGFYSTGIGEAASLDKTARAYLGGAHKTAAEEGIDVAALGSVVGYYTAHREAILRYCLQDCDLTARLFEKTIAGFERLGVPFPDEPWSRASVGRELLRRMGVLESTRKAYAKLSESAAARLWVKGYAGACILTRGVGAWDDVSKFDLHSAYPAPMPEFPSLEGAYLVDRSDPEFAACYFKFYEVDLVPTPRRALRSVDRTTDNLVYTEGGAPRRVCVTGLDLEAFDAWGDTYTVVDAVGVVTPSPDRPLAYMRDLYLLKSQVKKEYGEDSVEYLNIKTVLNGTYGILTQSRPREGRYTNFIYGAYITAWTRRELWLKAKELEGRGGTVLSFMTDGLFVTGLSTLPESTGELGTWEAKFKGEVVLFANGLYYVPKDATPQWDGLKKRGAPSLTVSALRRCKRPWVSVHRSGPLGLKQAIIQGRPEEIGVFSDEDKDLCPARMVEDAGLRMTPELRAAPLRSYFVDSWFLDYRSPMEATLPPNVLRVPL